MYKIIFLIIIIFIQEDERLTAISDKVKSDSAYKRHFNALFRDDNDEDNDSSSSKNDNDAVEEIFIKTDL